MIAVHWGSYLLIIVILVSTVIWPKKIFLVNILFFVGFFRSVMPFFDGEERRLRGDPT